MTEAGLKIDLRRKRILEMLAKEGRVQVLQLSRELSASVITIRNDLDVLGRNGHLERIRGGALRLGDGQWGFGFKKALFNENPDKRQVADVAAGMVDNGDTLFVNSGTSTYYVAMNLKRLKNLNIVTNSIPVALALGEVSGFRVLLLGGNLNVRHSFVYGPDAMEQMKKYTAKKAILSVNGISRAAGFTTYHAEEAALDQLMMERSQHTFIVADHSKYGHDSFYHISHPQENQTWITNDSVDPRARTEFLDTGMQIVLCG